MKHEVLVPTARKSETGSGLSDPGTCFTANEKRKNPNNCFINEFRRNCFPIYFQIFSFLGFGVALVRFAMNQYSGNWTSERSVLSEKRIRRESVWWFNPKLTSQYRREIALVPGERNIYARLWGIPTRTLDGHWYTTLSSASSCLRNNCFAIDARRVSCAVYKACELRWFFLSLSLSSHAVNPSKSW